MSQPPYQNTAAPVYYQQNDIAPVPPAMYAPDEKRALHDANPPVGQQAQYVAPQQQYVAPAQQPVYQHQAGPPSASDWSSGFWACFDPIDLYCFGYWCPCVLYGKTHARLTDPNLDNWQGVNGSCCAWIALAYCGASCILQTINRGDIRQRFGIGGSAGLDCLGAWCCPLCGLIQEEKELKRRIGQQQASAGGYVKPQAGMQYPATAQ